MPYILKKTKEKGKVGYKVCKRDEPERCFSKHPLTEKKARKQRTAIILSELGRSIPRGGMDGQQGNTENTPPAVDNQLESPRAPTRARTAARGDIDRPRMATGARRALFTDKPSSSSSEKAGPSSPLRSRQTSPSHTRPSISNGYTLEMCNQFLQNPKINPKTKNDIKLYKDKFNEIVDNCMNVMGNEFLNGLKQVKKPHPFKKEFLDEMTEKYDNTRFIEEKIKKEQEHKTKDETTCKTFIQNQTNDPENDSKIDIPSTKHIKLYNKCQKILPKELFEDLEKQFIDTTIPNNINGARLCKHIINNSSSKAIYNADGTINKIKTNNVGNPFNYQNINFEHPLIPLLLKKCENDFLMQVMVIAIVIKDTSANSNLEDTTEKYKEYFQKIMYEVHTYDVKNTKNFYVSYDNSSIISIINNIVEFITGFQDINYNEQGKIKILENLQIIVTDLIDKSVSILDTETKNRRKIYLDEGTRKNLQSCLFEIEALKEGIVMHKEIESSESSDIEEKSKAAWRSKSLEIPVGLPVLPKRTRAEILTELGKVCRDTMDILTLQEFETMKRKKLELVVHVGAKNEEGKQSCYYVESIFKSIKVDISNNKPPRDPATKSKITETEIEEMIMPKMKYIDINVINPITKQKSNKIPNIKLDIKQVYVYKKGTGNTPNYTVSYENDKNYSRRPFYQIKYIRSIGTISKTYYYETGGFIPMNIYVNEADRGDIPPHETDAFARSVDITSSVIMAKLDELVDKGMFANIYGQSRSSIHSKTIEYWYDTEENIISKAKLFIDELNDLSPLIT